MQVNRIAGFFGGGGHRNAGRVPDDRVDEITVKHEKLLYPVVRVRSGNSGGSGIVIYSSDRKDKGIFRTYVLTNHHVCSK